MGKEFDAIGVGMGEFDGSGGLEKNVDIGGDDADAGDTDGARSTEEVSRGGRGGGGDGRGLSFEMFGDGWDVVAAAGPY